MAGAEAYGGGRRQRQPPRPIAHKIRGITTATPELPATVGFASLGLADALVKAVAALGYEEPTPIQREAIPVLLAGKRPHRPGRHRHRQDRGVRAAAAPSADGRDGAAAGQARRRARPDPRPDARAGDAGGRSRPQVREATRRSRVVPLYGGAPMDQQIRALTPRRRRRRRHARPRARPPAAPDARARRARGARARRSRRDARHGLCRGSRGHPHGDAGHAADGALCGDDGAADRVDRGAAPEEAGAHHDQGREARGRQAAADPPGRRTSSRGRRRRTRSAASSSSKIRRRRSSSAARGSKSTS